MKAFPESLWLTATTWMEAQGEPDEGKVAVAYVIRNRAKARRRSVGHVCLERLQFSCWNQDSTVRLRLPDVEVDDPAWTACRKAAEAALLGSVPDPTHGATHYLNEAVVQANAGRLPNWFKPEKVTTRIGHHTFLKLEG